MKSLYFEDFNVGDEYTTNGRTVTETDVINFVGLSWDTNPIHTDKEYAEGSLFGERIAHGALGFVMHTGLSAQLGIFRNTIIAFLGMTWNFLKPIKINDTIHVKQIIKEKRETKKADRGIMIIDTQLINQHGDIVQQGDKTIMIKRKTEM